MTMKTIKKMPAQTMNQMTVMDMHLLKGANELKLYENDVL